MLSKIKKYLYLDVYLKFTGALHWRYEALRRSIREARRAWSCYDFDFAYLYDVQLNKARDLQKCLLEDPYHDLSHADLPQLQEYIDILQRLRDENYDEIYIEEHNKKWGNNMEIRTVEELITGVNRLKSHKECQDWRECWDKGEQDRNKDIDKMCEILKTSSRKWWC